jgi:hypothetical protein
MISSSLQRRVALLEQDSSSDDLQAERAAAREYYANPLGFVMWAFPWGKGTLANFTGPDDWQREFLKQLGQEVQARGFDGTSPVDAIRMATASGHGIGKALSKRTMLDTPDGLREWSSLKVGDRVFAEDGTATENYWRLRPGCTRNVPRRI